MSESTLKNSVVVAEKDCSRSGLGNINRAIEFFASGKVTVLGMVLLGLSAFSVSYGQNVGHWFLIFSLVLLSFNLIVALIVNPAFRSQPALFGFHVALIFLALSVAYGHLTRFRGHIEISEGQIFDPSRIIPDRIGLIAPELPQQGVFKQRDVTVNYASKLVRRETTSTIELHDTKVASITDGTPLVIDNYRFYVTHNKGFSALLTWMDPVDNQLNRGTLHFPSYPRLSAGQSKQWITPGGTELELTLVPEKIPQSSAWKLRRDRAGESLSITTTDGQHYLLSKGQEIELQDGKLKLEQLGLWIGYRIFYDPSIYWLLSSAFLSVILMTMHIWLRLKKVNGLRIKKVSRQRGIHHEHV